MKALITLSMVLGTVLVLAQPAQAWPFGWGESCCGCQTTCCKPTCCQRPTCCPSAGFLGYQGGGVWNW